MTSRITGVRPPPASQLWNGGLLQYADAGDLPLAPGDWVVVDSARVSEVEGGPGAPDTWVGEVVIAPEQLVEAAPLGTLPRVLRLASPAERPPARTEGAGLHLLRSLGLPTAYTHPGPHRPGAGRE